MRETRNIYRILVGKLLGARKTGYCRTTSSEIFQNSILMRRG
jgi:hypothetical protein